jgi:hypothetical protein
MKAHWLLRHLIFGDSPIYVHIFPLDTIRHQVDARISMKVQRSLEYFSAIA